MKINSIIKVEKKKEYWEDSIDQKHPNADNIAFNRGQEDYGNKEIGLDVGKIMEVLDSFTYTSFGDKKKDRKKQIMWLLATRIELAQALKAQEKSIIVEVGE